MADHSIPPFDASPQRPAPSLVAEKRTEAPAGADSREALRSFVESGSGAAFAALAQRYAGLVYGAARRRTGSHELAEEVAQNVFTILARKAPALARTGTPLAAWLHRAAVLESSQAARRETTRQRAMKEFAARQELAISSSGPAPLDSILPDLDAALDELPRADRELLLARYFEERSYRDLAAATGRSEAALMQQHHRALEKLARLFRRRGFATATTALGAGLGAPLASAAPAGLAAACAAGATATTAAGISASTAFHLTLAMQTKTQLAAAAAILCLLSGVGSFVTSRWQQGRATHHQADAMSANRSPEPGAPFVGGAAASTNAVSPFAALPIPTAAEILAAKGRERLEKLALWLPTASAAEMGDMLEKLAAMEESRTQKTEYELIIQRWVEVDREGAFAAIRKVEGYTWIACEAWGRLQPREAWEAAQTMDEFEKGYVLNGIAATDLRLAEEILTSADNMDVVRKGRLLRDLAKSWARKDPRQGWEFALQRGASIEGGAVNEWIRSEPDAAIAFVAGQPTARQQRQGMIGLMDQLREHHPEKIEPLLASLPEGRVKWQTQARHAWALARENFASAVAYAQNPEISPMGRAAMTQALAAEWAEKQPDAVLELLRGLDWTLTGEEAARPEIVTASTATPSFGESKAAEALFKLAGHGHLDEALAVAEAVPPGPRRDQALGAVAAGWPAEQVGKLSEWLPTQSAPSVREAGARKIVEHLMAEPEPDFEAAAHWAATLPPAEKPENSEVVRVMRKWREQEPEAAQALMKTLNVPDSLRAAIEQPTQP